MGNKPKARFKKKSLTGRVMRHPSVAYYAYPKAAPCTVLVPFVHDELLVRPAVLESEANKLLNVRAERIGTVFDGLEPPGEDVEIWKLKEVPGDKRFPDVAHLVWRLRAEFRKEFDSGHVAPNHVLIPANFHTCPWGPPEPLRTPPPPPLTDRDRTTDVLVIDSGWAEPKPDFIDRRSFADWLSPAGAWVPGAPDPPTVPPGPLPALTAHANFVAGVVAQACAEARIEVVSLSGAFVDGDATGPGIPTEAAVARALWQYGQRHDLIHVGFAFPTLPDIPLTREDADLAGPPSWALQVVLDALGRERFVVAPAGNQSCNVPQYPAAFGPPDYPNVIGVGSIRNVTNRSSFSNYGPWVKCCTEGEDVVSTFIHFDGTTEEPEPGTGNLHPRKIFEGWASWTGTSFSSPKVTGDLACLKRSTSLGNAWNQLKNKPDNGLQMGAVLDDLPPV